VASTAGANSLAYRHISLPVTFCAARNKRPGRVADLAKAREPNGCKRGLSE